MDPLSITASIIAALQLSAKVLEYLTNVTEASKHRTQFALETSNLYNLLFNLRARVEDGDATKPWFTAVRALAVENGPLDQFKQALEMLRDKMTDRGRLKKVSDALVWKFNKEEVASILGRMERLKMLVEIALQMDHFKLSQAIKDDTQAIKDDTQAIKVDIQTVKEDATFVRSHVHNTEHCKLLEWISPTDYPAQQSDIIKRREEGTCQWFLNANEVARWLREAKATLFCSGIPGAGKTIVAAIAIDHLLSIVQNGSIGVAYLYCNYKAKEEQDATNMLAAILKQLVQSQPSTVELVERLYNQHAGRGTRPSLDEVFSTLQDVLTRYATVYIVIDALDECQEDSRRQLLAKLRDLKAGRDIRLMATSRFIPEIVDAFQGVLRLEVLASKEDVKRFVAGQIYRLPKCVQRDAVLQLMVQERIAEAADGMFLLARLYTDSLLDKRTAKDVKLTLAGLSKGSSALDNAYKDAIQRIEGQLQGDYELAKKVLSWITFAKRPLTTAEIRCALAIEPDDAELDLENILDVEDLLSVCAGLVVVDRESAVIRLVHYSTQEYFERIRDTWNPGAQLQIATTCLTYLLFSTFKSGSCSTDKELKDRLCQHELVDYAARHWGTHARAVESEVANLACTFLLQNTSLSCVTQVQLVSEHKYRGFSNNYPTGSTALHCTARFGLSTVTERLFLRVEDGYRNAVNTKDSWRQTPLCIAAKYGHFSMAKLLLDKGADIDGEGRSYGKTLYVASENGHERVVKLLLGKGANVNASSGLYDSNALYAASEKGHERTVKLLLDNGADVNVRSGLWGSNALYAASKNGHERVVKLLLDNGADVNSRTGLWGSNALYAASDNGHERRVKLLADSIADVNVRVALCGSNALYAASENGHERIVKLLLDNGADVNAWGGLLGDNALCAASGNGHEQVVKLLLDNGANVNASGGLYDSNALYAASYNGHERVVELLLDKGANARSPEYGNALYVASEKGHEQVVKLLLDKAPTSTFRLDTTTTHSTRLPKTATSV